jgi:hypothetical protein
MKNIKQEGKRDEKHKTRRNIEDKVRTCRQTKRRPRTNCTEVDNQIARSHETR